MASIFTIFNQHSYAPRGNVAYSEILHCQLFLCIASAELWNIKDCANKQPPRDIFLASRRAETNYFSVKTSRIVETLSVYINKEEKR